MCVAIPSKIIQIQDDSALVDVYGARRDISLLLMPEPVSVGDFVLVHAGFAIQKLAFEDARERLDLLKKALLE